MPDLKKAEFGYTGTVAGRDVANSDSPVLTVLQEGLGSPEHQAFVAQLSRASAVTICVN